MKKLSYGADKYMQFVSGVVGGNQLIMQFAGKNAKNNLSIASGPHLLHAFIFWLHPRGVMWAVTGN